MCFLLLIHRVNRRYPVIVAANRDEMWDRPSEPPRVRGGDPRLIAPADARHGGTWIGVNSAGLFVAVTNRPAGSPDPTAPSRGLLALAALRRKSIDAVRDTVEEQLHRSFNPFHLICADSERAVVLEADGGLETHELDPGLHVVTNHGDVDTVLREEVRVTHGPARAWADTLDPDRLLHDLRRVAADRETTALSGHTICSRFDDRGTVSTSLVLLPVPGGSGARLLHADDAPLPREFTDYSSELEQVIESGAER